MRNISCPNFESAMSSSEGGGGAAASEVAAGGGAAAAGGVAAPKAGKKRFEVKKWNAVALWAWVS